MAAEVTPSHAERQVLNLVPQYSDQDAFPPAEGPDSDRPTQGTGNVNLAREMVNYPDVGTRQAVQVPAPSGRDFGLFGPGAAVDAASEPGGGIRDLGPTLDPLLASMARARATAGPALNWTQFNVAAGVDLDVDVGFLATTFYIDNPTAQFMFIPLCQRWVAPFTLGVIMATQESSGRVRARWLAPDGITQPAAVTGQNATVIVLERDLPGAPGYRLDGIAGTNIPQSSAQAQIVATGTPVEASSGNQANANAVATLPGTAGKTTHITGFELTASGSTAALVVVATVAGLIGGVTLSYIFVFPAGITVAAQSVVVEFPQPIPASGPNTPITVTLPAGGAGNTNAAASAHGYQI